MTIHLCNDISAESAVCLQFPKFMAVKKIRPFFKSAHQADSENVKKILKSSFFKKILLRKPQRGHATSQIFCSKKLPIYAHNCTWVWKWFIYSFQELYLWLVDSKNS